MNVRATEARVPYLSVDDVASTSRVIAFFRHPSGRISLGRLAGVLAAVIIAVPVVLATVYYVFLASPIFVSESWFSVRSPLEASASDAAPGTSQSDTSIGTSGSQISGLGMGSVSDTGVASQNPFVVASYIMSPTLVDELDRDGWLRRHFSRAEIDHLSRLSATASRETLFTYWRRHVTAAVDRRSLAVLLRVRAYSAADAQEIAQRVLAASESMIAELTRRQRSDTLAVARAELAKAEARYETVSLKLRQLRREAKIVDPAREAQAASTTLLNLMRERIRLESELVTIRRLGIRNSPTITDLQSKLNSIESEIEQAKARLTGSTQTDTILGSIAALEKIELDRQFAQVMLNLATNVFERAMREAEQQVSFVIVYLEPTRPSDTTEPNPFASIAFVAALCAIAWLFTITASAIAIDQIT